MHMTHALSASTGRWSFDTSAGKDEILARRIGKNELTAMDATEALGKAEHQYYQEAHGAGGVKQYAGQFLSDPGKQDGLYWPVSQGQTPSPLSRLGDFATAAERGGNPEFNGYRYRILSKGKTGTGVKDYVTDGKMTKGFAILAYPAEYRHTGITSFLVGEDGTVYQKDLGEGTVNASAAMTEYDPTNGWSAVNAPSSRASRVEP
jgi:hypothetical protein